MLGRWVETDPDYPGVCIVANAIVARADDGDYPEPNPPAPIDRILEFFSGGRFPKWRRR